MELMCSRLLLLVTWSCVMTSSRGSPASWDRQKAKLSPADRGLRTSDDLPIPPIQEHPSKLLNPTRHDLNVTFLLNKLGRNFDPAYMSITRPRHLHKASHPQDTSGNSSGSFPYRRNSKGRLIPLGEMPEHLRKMNYKFIPVRLPDGSRIETGISAKLKKKLQQFLWAHTACPVVYRWKDLGIRFWPRYLKEGTCPPGKSSCSIPPGMKCRAAKVIHKSILRWHCQSPKNLLYSSVASHGSADFSINSPIPNRCNWLKVEYPVVSECACSCPGSGNSYA